MITLYGIPNCDTVKKARTWLTENGFEHRFHDFKKQGVPSERMETWLTEIGWEKLLNRKGTAWRQLDEEIKSSVYDATTARKVMNSYASTIKRPVVDWLDGSTVGFQPEDWLTRSK